MATDVQNQDAAVETQLPHVIAVLGSARSGTSCTAGILNTLGVSMGRFFVPANTKNPTGYFESTDLRMLLQQIFQGSLANGFQTRQSPDNIVKALQRHIAFRKDDGDPLGVKHPWLCLLVSEMAQAWPNLKVVSVQRDIDSIVASMSESQSASINDEQRRKAVTQLLATRDAELARLNIPTLAINYADILANPTKAVNDLAAFAGISPTQDQIAAAVAFVDSSLNHHEPSESGTASTASNNY